MPNDVMLCTGSLYISLHRNYTEKIINLDVFVKEPIFTGLSLASNFIKLIFSCFRHDHFISESEYVCFL